MNRKLIINNALSFIGLVLFQVLILNNIRLGGYINPFLYILFIIQLPSNAPKWLVLCLSFLLGFSVDMFSSEMGFHTFASTMAGFSRIYLFQFFFSKQTQEWIFIPSLSTISLNTFVVYAFAIVLIHSVSYFFIEIFLWNEFFQILLRAILSSIVTMVLIFFFEFLFKFKERNR